MQLNFQLDKRTRITWAQNFQVSMYIQGDPRSLPGLFKKLITGDRARIMGRPVDQLG